MKRKSPKQLRWRVRESEKHLMSLELVDEIIARGSKVERLPEDRYHGKKTHVARRRRRRNRDAQWREFDQHMYEHELNENAIEQIKTGGWESPTITVVKTAIDKWEVYGDNIN